MSTLASSIGSSTALHTSCRPTKVFKGHTNWVRSVAYFPDGRRMASACGDGTVIIWDTESGRRDGKPLQHNSSVSWIAISPGGRRIASGIDGGLVVWDVLTREVFHELKGGPVRHLAYSPDGRWIATVTRNIERVVRLWDADTGRPGREPLKCDGGGICTPFSQHITQTA
ncbi:WD40 repeat-like protein [Leucogyrophana mollusca]|uniref:WD40 repeat-like protein n=1 Tax=Leucogyrophana mollusca TaxID=85980 RepID=A0ACB8B2C5_9AGAM|nr:WD40 repeat-like protein [Leucogyrophana mollusca]